MRNVLDSVMDHDLVVFFLKDAATTEIYTLPTRRSSDLTTTRRCVSVRPKRVPRWRRPSRRDRKSTRLNSSHVRISYAVFCLKKKIFYDSLLNSATFAFDHRVTVQCNSAPLRQRGYHHSL